MTYKQGSGGYPRARQARGQGQRAQQSEEAPLVVLLTRTCTGEDRPGAPGCVWGALGPAWLILVRRKSEARKRILPLI